MHPWAILASEPIFCRARLASGAVAGSLTDLFNTVFSNFRFKDAPDAVFVFECDEIVAKLAPGSFLAESLANLFLGLDERGGARPFAFHYADDVKAVAVFNDLAQLADG